MPILPSKDIPMGAQDQPFAHCNRWKVNPDWLHELVQLNPSIGLMTAPLEHRVVVQSITMTALQTVGTDKLTADICIVVDWDAFHCAEYRNDGVSGPGDLYFVSSNPQFKLTEWEPEPTFGHYHQPGWAHDTWAVSNNWLKWALKKLGIDNLRESRNSRIRVSSFVIDKVAKLAGQDPNTVSLIIDWDQYVNEGSRFGEDIPAVIFISNAELDLRTTIEPQVFEPHGSANLMEKAAESSVVSTQEGNIKHVQLQGVELKGLLNQPPGEM